MAWIQSHQELGAHPKTRKLAGILGVHKMQAIGHLHALWWWALDYADDGDLSGFEAADVALGAEWDGDPEAFVSALRECGVGGRAGFLDADGALHDWDEYAGRLVERRRKDRERKAEQRATSTVGPADVDTASNGHTADGRGSSSRRVEKSREEDEPADPPAPDDAAPPVADGVVDHICQHLTERIADHRGDGKRPKVTAAWRKDVDLLLRRGELHIANPEPWTPEQAHERIDAVFDRLAVRSSSGFCWADQIRSPGNLRDKWHKIEPALRMRATAAAAPVTYR